MRVGWIGLGRMGRPMAENVLKAGFKLVVQNRSQWKVDELVAAGAERGGTFAEMAAGVDSLHTCLPDAPTVELVLAGPGGVFEGVRPGVVVVNHSTTSPAEARSLAARASAKGAVFLDAPISGSGARVASGQLTIMVGGDEQAFERVLPVLQAMGRTIRRMGPSGAGAVTKVVNDLVMAANAAVALEGLTLGARAGVDPWALFELIRTASGASRQWERNVGRALRREFKPDGPVQMLARNQDAAHDLAHALGLELSVFEASRPFWHRARAFLGDEDMAAAIRMLEGPPDEGDRVE